MATNAMIETFKATGEVVIEHRTYSKGEYTIKRQPGTIQVQWGRDVITVECSKTLFDDDGDDKASYHLFGFVGMYRTGNKPWRVSYSISRRNTDEWIESVWFGRDDRAGRCHKMHGISYNPEKYAQI